MRWLLSSQVYLLSFKGQSLECIVLRDIFNAYKDEID